MYGEYESQKAMYELVKPQLIPMPLGWGRFSSNPEIYFFLSDFIEMTDEIPRPTKFCAQLATLHQKSMENSPGKYGFHVNTFQGNILLENSLCDTWEEFFTRAMKNMIDKEAKIQGPSEDIERMKGPLLDEVIPRLLRPLETGTRIIRPCLVHGDLWNGNSSVAVGTGEPYIFDSCALWAHNECEYGYNAVFYFRF